MIYEHRSNNHLIIFLTLSKGGSNFVILCIKYLITFSIYRSTGVGAHTCITYDAVNQAYIDARKRIRK